jgi:hypothetical protein
MSIAETTTSPQNSSGVGPTENPAPNSNGSGTIVDPGTGATLYPNILDSSGVGPTKNPTSNSNGSGTIVDPETGTTLYPHILVPTASDIQEKRVQQMMPQARRAVSGQSPVQSLLQGQEVPFVAPLVGMATGALGAAMGTTEGDDFSTRYANQMAYQEARQRAQEEANPYFANVGKGIAASTGLLFPTTGVEAALTQTAKYMPSVPFLTKTIQSVAPSVGRALEGGLWGAASSGLNAPPGASASDIIGREASGAEMGAATNVILPPILGKIGGAAGWLYDAFRSPENLAAQKIVESAKSGGPGLSVADYIQQKTANPESPVSLIDISGAPSTLRKSSAYVPPEKVRELNDQLTQRLNESSNVLGTNIDAAMSDFTGGLPVNAFATRQSSQAEARAANAPAYKKAFSADEAQNIWNPQLENLIQSDEGKEAVAYAVNESKKDYGIDPENGPPLKNPFREDENGNYVLADPNLAPNLRFWDYVKRGLSNVGEGQTGDQQARTFNNAKALRDNLVNTVPDYETALTGAGKYIRADNALDAGMQFPGLANAAKKTTDATALDAVINKFNTPPEEGGYSDLEKQHFRVGLASWMKQNPMEAAKMFAPSATNQQTKDSLTAILGNKAVDSLDSAFTIQRLSGMNKTIQQSSPNTFAQLVPAAGWLGAGYGISQYLTSGDWKAALLSGAIKLSETGYNAANKKVASSLYDMATSNDPAVVSALHDAMNNNSGTKAFVKALEESASRIALQRISQNPQMNPLYSEGQPHATGGRIERASGGRAGLDHKSAAEALMRAAERAKKAENETTEPLLNLPDEAITKALSAANEAI